jgi:hypothetical protein
LRTSENSSSRNCLERLRDGLTDSPSAVSSPRRRRLARLRTASRNPCSSSCSERASRTCALPPTSFSATPESLWTASASASRSPLPLWPTPVPRLWPPPQGPAWAACVRAPPHSSPGSPQPISYPCPRIRHRAREVFQVREESSLHADRSSNLSPSWGRGLWHCVPWL